MRSHMGFGALPAGSRCETGELLSDVGRSVVDRPG